MAADTSNGPSQVIVRGGAAGFAQEIEIGLHHLTADEPVAFGGTDTGPSPYDFLLAVGFANFSTCLPRGEALPLGNHEQTD
jgi:hypothetical protein